MTKSEKIVVVGIIANLLFEKNYFIKYTITHENYH